MDILQRIDDLRKERGWSLYKLAEECMLTQSTLSNMYTRNTLPSLTTLLNICKGLGITPSEFFCETKMDIESIKNKKFVELFNKLGEKEKSAVISLMDTLTK